MRAFLFILSFLFFACTSNRYDARLVQADSLQEKDRDSAAFEQLKRIGVKELSERDKAFYYMLSTFVRYKLYIPLNDSTINNSIDYYMREGDDEMLSRAYLYKACSLAERNDFSPMVYYLKKAEYSAKRTDNVDVKLRIMAMMSIINMNTNNYQKAKEYVDLMFPLAKQSDNKRWLGLCYEYMAFLSEKETIEEELYYYRKAEGFVDCLKKEEQAGLYNNMSIVYSKMGNAQKAETLLLRSLYIYPSAHAYGTLAELYTTQNRLQEARELWNKALKTKDVRLRSTFLQPYAAWLHKIGDEDEAWSLAMKIPFVKDSLMRVQQTEMVKENQEVQDRLKRELEHRQKIMVLCFVIVLLIMCAALTYIVLELKMVRQKKVLAEDRNRINELQATIEVLTQKEGENSEKLKRARKQMEKMRENLAQKTALGKKLYEEIFEQGGKTSKWFKKDFEAFCEYYRTIDPEFFVMLESTYDRLTPRQVFIMVLDHKNYTEEQILEIMCMSDGTLRTNRSRIAARYIPLDDK